MALSLVKPWMVADTLECFFREKPNRQGFAAPLPRLTKSDNWSGPNGLASCKQDMRRCVCIILYKPTHVPQQLAQLAEEIEVDLDFVGATAVEDKLQTGVPECIERLRMVCIVDINPHILLLPAL